MRTCALNEAAASSPAGWLLLLLLALSVARACTARNEWELKDPGEDRRGLSRKTVAAHAGGRRARLRSQLSYLFVLLTKHLKYSTTCGFGQ
jgi:hypothetical protein